MSSGVFGTIRPAKITESEIGRAVEVLYHYRPTRGEENESFEGFRALKSNDVLVPSVLDSDESIIGGMYNLRLPLDVFNKKGYYTVYIRPKECKTEIVDVSVLAAYPDVKGVVFNLGRGSLVGLSDLTGYRMEFEDGTTRLIKSCNRCEPVVVNAGDGYPKATRYNLVDGASDYVFCTVSPSSLPSFKTNASPYIGEPGVTVTIANTKFSPKMIEIEMVNHDADTISYMLEGDQANNRDSGMITTYNENKEIYHQADYYVIKDKLGNPLYNIKKKRTDIDGGESYENTIE